MSRCATSCCPDELKRAFASVIVARKEGEAALERARAETASLRSLANAGPDGGRQPGPAPAADPPGARGVERQHDRVRRARGGPGVVGVGARTHAAPARPAAAAGAPSRAPGQRGNPVPDGVEIERKYRLRTAPPPEATGTPWRRGPPPGAGLPRRAARRAPGAAERARRRSRGVPADPQGAPAGVRLPRGRAGDRRPCLRSMRWPRPTRSGARSARSATSFRMAPSTWRSTSSSRRRDSCSWRWSCRTTTSRWRCRPGSGSGAT